MDYIFRSSTVNFIATWRHLYRPGVGKLCLRAKSSLLPIFFLINKALLEHSDVHLFIQCLWVLSHYNHLIELSSYKRDCRPTKPELFPIGSFSENVCQPWSIEFASHRITASKNKMYTAPPNSVSKWKIRESDLPKGHRAG